MAVLFVLGCFDNNVVVNKYLYGTDNCGVCQEDFTLCLCMLQWSSQKHWAQPYLLHFLTPWPNVEVSLHY